MLDVIMMTRNELLSLVQTTMSRQKVFEREFTEQRVTVTLAP
jgi:hypothetical protein